MTNFVKEILLIEGAEAKGLYKELTAIATLFIGPMFLSSLVAQFFGEYDFLKVIKKLLIVSVVMTSFYTLHTRSVDLSMEVANKTFKKVSPKNVFRKKWYRATLSKRAKKSSTTWELVKEFVTPALNDLIASTFFVTSSIFMSLLKYIYTSIYHLTYIFAGFSALLYFWGITEGALWGMVKSSLWCVLLPFVFISILSLIGNGLETKAASGINMFSEIETIIWLFCVSLMLLMCPLITWKLVNSEGIAASAPQMGAISILAGSKALNNASMLPSIYRETKDKARSAKEKFGSYLSNNKSESSRLSNNSEYFSSRNQKSRNSRVFSKESSNRTMKESSSSTKQFKGSDQKSSISSQRNSSSDRSHNNNIERQTQKQDLDRSSKDRSSHKRSQSERTSIRNNTQTRFKSKGKKFNETKVKR
jgi:hypothetical protein